MAAEKPDRMQGTGFSYPGTWIKGQLLDVKRFNDGTFKVLPLGEELAKETRNWVEFPSASTCQQFISWWYTAEGRAL